MELFREFEFLRGWEGPICAGGEALVAHSLIDG